jgi:hypothetical protein
MLLWLLPIRSLSDHYSLLSIRSQAMRSTLWSLEASVAVKASANRPELQPRAWLRRTCDQLVVRGPWFRHFKDQIQIWAGHCTGCRPFGAMMRTFKENRTKTLFRSTCSDSCEATICVAVWRKGYISSLMNNSKFFIFIQPHWANDE